MSRPGDYCRTHTAEILGCSGQGRPSCQAAECLFGAEPCPDGNHFKAEGHPCAFCAVERRKAEA
jgi:hypothetical protein